MTVVGEAEGPTTEDAMLGGRLVLAQAARGYRAGADAALLAAACAARPGERVVEAGCGPGGALLAAAIRRPGAVFVGVEQDPAALALAEKNISRNALSDRVSVIGADVGLGFAALGEPAFDWAIANPPFFDDPGALRAPKPERRAARISAEGLDAWVEFLFSAVKPRGQILVIHRADRLADILASLEGRAGSVRVLAVHPFADANAKRVIVAARRGGRAPLTLAPPLILHDRTGAKHTERAEAIFRGEADLPL